MPPTAQPTGVPSSPLPTPFATPPAMTLLPPPPPPPAPTPFRTPPPPTVLATSPEAGRIAFNLSDGGGAWLYEGSGGRASSLTAFRLKTTADGRSAATLPSRPGVDAPVFMDLRTGEQRSLPPQVGYQYEVTDDGRRLAYLSDRSLYVVDPDRPVRAVFPDYHFTSARWSPSGRLLALTGPVIADALPAGTTQRSDFVACDLWVVDFEAKTLRQVFVDDRWPLGRFGERRCSGIEIGTWSPDERYVAVYLSVSLSAGLSGEPRSFAVVDLRAGTATHLGTTLAARGWQAWTAPHTLAFVAAAGRAGWDQRLIRLWSPEAGARNVTTLDEMAFGPAWDATGRYLFFIRAPAGPWVGEDYFAGLGIGARHIVRVDLETGARDEIARSPGYAEEALRVAADRKDLLIVRRRTDVGAPVELWLWPLDGRAARPLVTVPLGRFGSRAVGDLDLAYWMLVSFGSYSFFDSAAWSR